MPRNRQGIVEKFADFGALKKVNNISLTTGKEKEE